MSGGISEYGKSLADIGKIISEISSIDEKNRNFTQKFDSNINICQGVVNTLQKLEVPSIISKEHEELTNTFHQLLIAYTLQRDSINEQGEVIDWGNFDKGKKIENEETQSLGPTLMSMLIRSSSLII